MLMLARIRELDRFFRPIATVSSQTPQLNPSTIIIIIIHNNRQSTLVFSSLFSSVRSYVRRCAPLCSTSCCHRRFPHRHKTSVINHQSVPFFDIFPPSSLSFSLVPRSLHSPLCIHLRWDFFFFPAAARGWAEPSSSSYITVLKKKQTSVLIKRLIINGWATDFWPSILTIESDCLR